MCICLTLLRNTTRSNKLFSDTLQLKQDVRKLGFNSIGNVRQLIRLRTMTNNLQCLRVLWITTDDLGETCEDFHNSVDKGTFSSIYFSHKRPPKSLNDMFKDLQRFQDLNQFNKSFHSKREGTSPNKRFISKRMFSKSKRTVTRLTSWN